MADLMPAAEVLATNEKLTVTFERLPDGKLKATSLAWEDGKVLLKDEVFEVRNVEGRLRFARKARTPDEKDLPLKPYDVYGDGVVILSDNTAA